MIVILMVATMGALVFPFLALDARKAYNYFLQRREAGEWMTVEEETFGMRQKGNESLFFMLFLVCLGISIFVGLSILF
ncbi:MAG: hypothetical protein J6Q14_08855 [Oscillospiraceae bacterium]|nr:hypothetical protein [Oscillospiraceae bacterium]